MFGIINQMNKIIFAIFFLLFLFKGIVHTVKIQFSDLNFFKFKCVNNFNPLHLYNCTQITTNLKNIKKKIMITKNYELLGIVNFSNKSKIFIDKFIGKNNIDLEDKIIISTIISLFS